MTTRSKRKAEAAKARRKADTDKTPRANCPHCVSGAETYGYLKRAWVFDVDEARKIVSDGRQPAELDTSDVEYLVNDSRIHEQHIDHVNTKYPGILAHLWGPGSNGAIEHGHVLIDGNHRAARCLRDNIPFHAYLLSEEESERILLRGILRDGSVRNDLGDEHREWRAGDVNPLMDVLETRRIRGLTSPALQQNPRSQITNPKSKIATPKSKPMSTTITTLSRIREGLSIQAISATEYVVKRADSQEYFSVGAFEAFLLPLFDGQHTAEDICAKFEAQFQSPLSESDLQEFIDAVKPMGLFRRSKSTSSLPESTNASGSNDNSHALPTSTRSTTDLDEEEDAGPKKSRSLQDQSLLYYRVPLFDPDKSLGKLVRFVPFLWTKGFLFLIVCAVLTALSITIEDGAQLAAGLAKMNTWSGAATFLIVIIVCASVHEAAHGATLKHFGGEVHDSGVLFMFFTPCLYCNVSDAWLLPEKWKRLAITAAGGISDLCLWALGVFVWRLTVVGTPVNQVALSVITMCGARSLINFNPLLRLDGYYLLSDWLSIPNLRTRAMDHWMANLRWLFWGAAKPPSIEHHRALLWYGLIVWSFALTFLNVIFLRFFEYMGGEFGIIGLLFVGLLLTFACRRVFKGLFESELITMLQKRPGRTTLWAVGILAGLALLFGVPVRSTTSGDFEVRPGSIVQLHTPVGGVIDIIHVEDGSLVEEGQLLAEMKSSSLESEILKTEDLLAEVEANLRRLKAGARREEVEAAKDRVRRLTEWYELGADELEQARIAHQQELLVQDHRVREITAELNNAKQDLQHSEYLYRQGALAGAQLRQQNLELMQIESRLAQVQASLSASRALGVKSKEAEISRREQELADAKSKLELLQAGSRPEEIAAEEARRERASHELAFQKSRREKLKIVAPTSGIFSAPRLKERMGMAVSQDALFGTIEKPETSRVEIAVSEDDAVHLRPGLPVTLKARAIPFETFEATVESIAPVALKHATTGQNNVLVHCQIRNPDGRLKSGMTGFGRVTRGWNTIGMMLLTKGIKYLRTEFWW